MHGVESLFEVDECDDTGKVLYLIPSINLLSARMCDVVDLSARKPFWFGRSKGSMCGRHRLRISRLKILAAIEVKLIPR